MTRDISGCQYFRGTKMTQRGPETLSRHFGFGSPQALADSLPEGAEVLDAGAGASTLGHAIGRLRPDISWTNLDPGYADQASLAALKATAPDNVSFVTGSMLEVAEILAGRDFQRVFSFFAINYLRESREAVRQLMRVAEPAGEMALGKFWVLEDRVASPCTITFSPGSFTGDDEHLILDAVDPAGGRFGAPPVPGVEYATVIGDDSVR